MKDRELKRLHSGQHESSTITPSCSYGWVGNPVAAWRDMQLALVSKQERDHIWKVKYGPQSQ